jgi:hypothetical protein
VQTIVAHAAVAEAVARLLVEDFWNFGGELVGVELIFVLGVGTPELIFGEDGREFFAWGGRVGVVVRDGSVIRSQAGRGD